MIALSAQRTGVNLSSLGRLCLTSALFIWFSIPWAVAANTAPRPVIVCFGDSLSAGYELAEADAFPARLAETLAKLGVTADVRNAAVSGDTTTGGLARLDWALEGPIDLVILELGANDALRGLDPKMTRQNLDQMIKTLKQRGIKVLLAGMVAPPNMGPDYAKSFNSIYPDLASQYGLALYPFFLEGVAAQPGLRLSDGMHPNPAGVKIMAERIAPIVIKALGAKPAKQ